MRLRTTMRRRASDESASAYDPCHACQFVPSLAAVASGSGTPLIVPRSAESMNSSYKCTTLAITSDDTVDAQATLDPVGGAAFKHELDRLEHRLYLAHQRPPPT
jgi:hypothetical protein